MYEELKKESDGLLAKKAADSKPITVTLPDSRQVPGKAWVTTPYRVACDIRLAQVHRDRSTSMWFTLDSSYLVHLSCSQGLADNAVISRVNGDLWDLDRPLEGDCSLELLRFDDEEAQAVRNLRF